MAWNTPTDWAYKEAPGSSKMNSQVRDNLNYLKAMMPAGVMLPYGGAAAPAQFLLCDGSAVSRSTYADLYAAIGVAYGAGDGSSTFNLPDLKGKIPVGKNAAETEFDTLGEAGGAKTHTLTEVEMPAHTHNQNTGDGTGSRGCTNDGDSSYTGLVTGSTGGGGAHNNLPPYLTINYIIKY